MVTGWIPLRFTIVPAVACVVWVCSWYAVASILIEPKLAFSNGTMSIPSVKEYSIRNDSSPLTIPDSGGSSRLLGSSSIEKRTSWSAKYASHNSSTSLLEVTSSPFSNTTSFSLLTWETAIAFISSVKVVTISPLKCRPSEVTNFAKFSQAQKQYWS